MLLGVDTGGTFTDFVYIDRHGVRIHKVLSTPKAPEEAIIQGIEELGVDDESLLIVHGSTVATNAVLEKKGVRCCFITNHGLADMLTIGRQARKELYHLNPEPQKPPVPKELCLETGGRVSAAGELVEPLTDQEIGALVEKIKERAPEAIAINLLFSFLDDAAEKRLEKAMPADIFVSRSSEVLAEYKEYERGIATWLNAYVGPLVMGYLDRLTRAVKSSSVSVMQSSGGTIAAEQAGRHAVRMLLSGPAGGLMAALHMGKQAGFQRLLTLDMGGTSTDVSLLDGAVSLTNEGKIEGYPVAVPMVDMHTIGAGGGSIAYVDSGGLLCVGPESAGASPGPACYGQGGVRVTVTDANVFLGRISARYFLGGNMSLDIAATKKAMEKLALELGCSPEEAAKGVIKLADEHMARALRVISIQRGIDPRPFALMTFGGAGGLHVCALAEALGIETAIIPVNSGVLSAFGMLAAPRSRELSRSLLGVLTSIPVEQIEQGFLSMVEQGQAELMAEGVMLNDITVNYSVDLRYVGQSYTLAIPWHHADAAMKDFHSMHKSRYGHDLDLAVELVNLRVSLSGEMPKPGLVEQMRRPIGEQIACELDQSMRIYQRKQLKSNDSVTGEALIVEQVATTYLAPNWQCEVDRWGNLVLSKMA
ncbi:MAG: hydantoinase [Cycloclasticus sp.]|nr:hydantoinase [Cycloclasticus sp.]MBG96668.1 hydantoinase [Cycloclasticus sp.]HAI96005.1 hydantoinase [Methylococcaceae bacterium]